MATEPPLDSWRTVADELAAALRACQVPADWPIAWPDGMSEGAPWVDEALAMYDKAIVDAFFRQHPQLDDRWKAESEADRG